MEEVHQLAASHTDQDPGPKLGTEPTTWVCTLTGSQTSNPSVTGRRQSTALRARAVLWFLINNFGQQGDF